MPLFTRRRLQAMLDELSSRLTVEKQKDLIERLENKRVEQALPAQMELALLWAIGQLGSCEIEPEWTGESRRPDAYTKFLDLTQPAVIDIFAVSDNKLSGEATMDMVARQMLDYANKVSPGIGNYLYFTFGSEFVFKHRGYRLRRRVPKNYRISTYAKSKLRKWIQEGHFENKKLVIEEHDLHVVVEKKTYKQTRYHNIFSFVPPAAESTVKNPIYQGLRSKLPQMAAAPVGTLRFIFLADVGSMLLTQLIHEELADIA